MNILVTGGAGYIGSHVVRQLWQAGHQVVVFDNLSTGHEWAVPSGLLVRGDLSDSAALRQVFASRRFDAVMHFAASVVVPESVRLPWQYYANNTGNTLALLQVCHEFGVERLVFSSTAAVYGDPDQGIVSEQTPVAPISPYGASKMMSERMIQDAAAASSLRYVILRYFNVAGADPEGHLGQVSANATHLIKTACEAVLGRRPGMSIFGDDYPTVDGTCVRDYIHVSDLASAHLNALDYLGGQEESQVINCGYGHGYSVREVIDAVQRVSGVRFPVSVAERRAGDSPMIVADNRKVKKVLGWTPRYDDLDLIVRTALDWDRRQIR